ncbi:PaaI family thioesterase [Leuconostoc holzapfelii]|uniref:PaaI family thioesterase n=1 Tax=Leuconostoc holzapfelii TaxID=434464 RepID=A0A846ZIA0_9LACO|nr:PaaI family thioesterase [Leuconostoc holzapfelii]NKZ18533.1 PaaI family thioesterase [Leuconostoc holzapfelii]
MNIIELLGLKTTVLSAKKMVVTVTVSEQLLQPYGLVHGGINALLAETAASQGANAALPDGQVAVGVGIETHHLAPVTHGELVATATPITVGHRIQVWSVSIHESQTNTLTSTSTVTLTTQTRSV